MLEMLEFSSTKDKLPGLQASLAPGAEKARDSTASMRNRNTVIVEGSSGSSKAPAVNLPSPRPAPSLVESQASTFILKDIGFCFITSAASCPKGFKYTEIYQAHQPPRLLARFSSGLGCRRWFHERHPGRWKQASKLLRVV